MYVVLINRKLEEEEKIRIQPDSVCGVLPNFNDTNQLKEYFTIQEIIQNSRVKYSNYTITTQQGSSSLFCYYSGSSAGRNRFVSGFDVISEES